MSDDSSVSDPDKLGWGGHWPGAGIVAVDVIAMAVVMSVGKLSGVDILAVGAFAVVCVAAFLGFDGYDFRRRYASYQQLGLLGVVGLLGVTAAAGASLWTGGDSKGITWMAVFTGMVGIAQVIVRRSVIHSGVMHVLTRPVIVVGRNWMAEQIGQIVEQRGEKDEDGQELNVDARNSVLDLRAGRRGDRMVMRPGRGIDGQDFFEALTRRVPVPEVGSTVPDHIRPIPRPLKDLIYRSFGRLLALLVLIISAPLWVFAVVVILLDDRGPVFFTQERVGHLGSRFTILKFRTMRQDESGVPMVTKAGKLLRPFRIDELPQLINVITGDLSLIGPRPFVVDEVNYFIDKIPLFELRHTVRPGITGLAQVSHRYENSLSDAREKLGYDLYYVKNRGLFLDVLLFLWSLGTIVGGSGE